MCIITYLYHVHNYLFMGMKQILICRLINGILFSFLPNLKKWIDFRVFSKNDDIFTISCYAHSI